MKSVLVTLAFASLFYKLESRCMVAGDYAAGTAVDHPAPKSKTDKLVLSFSSTVAEEVAKLKLENLKTCIEKLLKC